MYTKSVYMSQFIIIYKRVPYDDDDLLIDLYVRNLHSSYQCRWEEVATTTRNLIRVYQRLYWYLQTHLVKTKGLTERIVILSLRMIKIQKTTVFHTLLSQYKLERPMRQTYCELDRRLQLHTPSLSVTTWVSLLKIQPNPIKFWLCKTFYTPEQR